MNEQAGKVFSVAAENQPIPGCTASKVLHQEDGAAISFFSLALGTDISPESYGYHKLIHVEEGDLLVAALDGRRWTLNRGDVVLTPLDIPVGMRTDAGCVYTEVEIRKDSNMNEVLKDGQVLKLAELLPYQDGKIVNMDLARNEKMKFLVMSFDEGTGLSEHSAPGEALVFALEGKGIIGYEGREHAIEAGENFKFAKNGRHWIKADGRFKMALLMILE